MNWLVAVQTLKYEFKTLPDVVEVTTFVVRAETEAGARAAIGEHQPDRRILWLQPERSGG